MFWRESSQDVSIFAIWLSRNVTDLVFILLQTLGFVGIVYDMTNPLMTLSTYFNIYVSIGYANSGLGYLLSTFIPRRNLTLYSALLAVLVGAFFSGTLPYLFDLQEAILLGTSSTAATKLFITKLSYSRWTVEALVTTEIMMAPPGIISVYGVETFETAGYACLNEMYNNETIESYEKPFERMTKDFLMPDLEARVVGQALLRNLWPMFWIGTVTRILALLGLYVFDRKQQNKTGCMDIIYNILCMPCQACRAAKATRSANHRSHRNLRELKTDSPNNFSTADMIVNPFFGETNLKKTTTTSGAKSRRRTMLKNMYRQAIDSTSTSSANNEGWLERIEGHGLSSKIRSQRLQNKMNVLFDIWDKIGDGILDEDDMSGITKQLQNKVQGTNIQKKRTKKIESHDNSIH